MGSSESKEGQASNNDQKEETMSDTALKAACAVGAVAAGAAILWGLASSSSSNEDGIVSKMMKAPGRNGELMPRKDFEDDPKDYFRNLRGKDK